MVGHHTFVISPGLLELNSNVETIPGFLSGRYPVSRDGAALVRIRLTVGGQMQPVPRDAAAFGWVRGKPQAEEIDFSAPVLGSLRFRLQLRRLPDSPELQVGPVYYRLGKLRIGSVLPAGKHLLDVAIVKLLQHGYLLIHGAAVALCEKGILLAGAPGAGKSLTALRATNRGCTFLSEDATILSGGRLYGFPYTTTFAYNREASQRAKSPYLGWNPRLYGWLNRWAPVLALLMPPPALNIQSLLPNAQIGTTANLAYVFILSRGPRRMEKIKTDDAYRRLLTINRNEFSYQENGLLLAYSFLNSTFDIVSLIKREEELLKAALAGADCFFCQSESHEDLVDTILRVAEDSKIT